MALLENGHVHHVRVPVHGAIDFVVFIPDFQLSTEKARAALPKTIDHHDAVYNLARAALLAGSLTTGKLENLDAATGDCLHQPYRFGLIENGEDIVREAKKLGALGAFISGAGPSIVAIVYKGDRDYITRAQELCEKHYPHWKAVQLRCDEVGATVKRL